jgi:hypothetical protein
MSLPACGAPILGTVVSGIGTAGGVVALAQTIDEYADPDTPNELNQLGLKYICETLPVITYAWVDNEPLTSDTSNTVKQIRKHNAANDELCEGTTND